jgi:hypothetical protein
MLVPKDKRFPIIGIGDLNGEVGLCVVDSQAVLSSAPVIREPDTLPPKHH